MKIVLLEWVDPNLIPHWIPRDEDIHTVKNVTIGILVKETDDEIEINPTVNPGAKLAPISFPKSSKIRMRQLCLK